MVVDSQKKEMIFDLTKSKDHIRNQQKYLENGNAEVRRNKMWQALLDSEFACDVVLNPKLMKNIRLRK